MASTNKSGKRIFLAPRTLCKNRAQSLRERGLHCSPSTKQHSPDVTSSLKELQHVEHVEASSEVLGEGGETTNVAVLNQSGEMLLILCYWPTAIGNNNLFDQFGFQILESKDARLLTTFTMEILSPEFA